MNGKIDPPHITGANTQEQLRQVIRYLWSLTEQLNMELDRVQAQFKQLKEE